MSSLYVIGAGGHGAVVAEAAAESNQWKDVLFLDDNASLETVLDFPVVGSTTEILALADANSEIIVAIGDNRHRLDVCEEILRSGLRLATVIHPSACISKSALLSAGTVVCAGAIINARTKVGRACILNTGATIDHDCELEDGVHVSPGANIAGGVKIEKLAWVGIGASVREGIVIGQESVVGAGSAVVADVARGARVGGVPAKRLPA